jgi:hypothetical protein
MNYVPFLFFEEHRVMPALIEEAITLTSLALFIGMVAIWAQVIATL